MTEPTIDTLVLGIGNVLMGDEGVGVSVVREIELLALPPDIECLDGGTGSFQLLEPLGRAARVILVDATADGKPVGTVTRLTPRFSSDYPLRLTAHDIGLKDLLDAFYLLGEPADVTLFAVSIEFPQPLRIGLSRPLRARLPDIVATVREELEPVAAPRTAPG